MKQHTPISVIIREACTMLLVAAFMFRALMPVGFMPDFGADGMQVVICAGASEKAVTLDADGKPMDAPAHESDFDICGFSVNTGGVAAASPVIVEPLAFSTIEILRVPSDITTSRNPASKLSRAPPSA